MELQNIFDLIDCFETSTLTELKLELQGAKVQLKRSTGEETNTVQIIQPSNKETVSTQIQEQKAKTESVQKKQTAAKAILAPLVGTFYRASSPDTEPFVKVGQQVKKGDVIGIIEAMKMMNEVTATEDGVVEKILVEDESLVSFHQVLIELS